MDLFAQPTTKGRDLFATPPVPEQEEGLMSKVGGIIAKSIGADVPIDAVQGIYHGIKALTNTDNPEVFRAEAAKANEEAANIGLKDGYSKEAFGNAVGSGLKLGSFFVPVGTLAKAATNATLYSAGQLASGEVSKKGAAINTAVATALPYGLGKATELITPIFSKLSGMDASALNNIYKAAKIKDNATIDSILKKEGIATFSEVGSKLKGLKLNGDSVANLLNDLTKSTGSKTLDGFTLFRRTLQGASLLGTFFHPAALTYEAATTPFINTKAAVALGKLMPQIEKFSNVERAAFINLLNSLNNE